MLKDRATLEEVLASLKEFCGCSEDDINDASAPYDPVVSMQQVHEGRALEGGFP